MGFLDRFRPVPSAGSPEIARSSSLTGDEKAVTTVGSRTIQDHAKRVAATAEEDSDNEDELVHTDMQRGIQKAEAMCQVWPKWALFATYAWIWVIYFLDALEGPVGWQLTPFVTSEFRLHGLTGVTSVVAQIVAGLWRLPLAKIIDIWGRPEGLAISVIMMTLGSVMMAATNSVQMYAAAEVFSQTGGNARNFVLSIILADTSQLKNRGLVLAYIASPYLITTFTSGYFVAEFLDTSGPGWRWAFGIFAILHPILNIPLFVLLMWYQRKGINAGLVATRNSGRSVLQSIKFYVIEFDILGLLLLCGGLAVFLLPFSLYSYQGSTLAEQWSSALVISMIVIGFFTLAAFAVWEVKFAPVTIIPWALMKNRTIIGGAAIAAILFFEFYIWNSYFSSFLQAVVGLDFVQVGYILNIYSMGSCFWAFISGFIVRYTGDYKWQCVFFGMPFTLLGVALMIVFRQPGVNVGYIVMCQLFIAFGGGALVIGQQVAVMAAVTHQYIAVVLAILAVANAIGGALGSTVATAIWTGTFYNELTNNLPPETASNATLIYGDLATQLTYPIGDPTRDAIQIGYGNAQRYMLIGATAVTVLGFPAVLLWKGYDARARKQVKGRVL